MALNKCVMNVAPWITASSPWIKFATEWPEIMKLIEIWFKMFPCELFAHKFKDPRIVGDGNYTLMDYHLANRYWPVGNLNQLIIIYMYSITFFSNMENPIAYPWKRFSMFNIVDLQSFNTWRCEDFHLSVLFRSKRKKCLNYINKSIILHTYRHFDSSFDQFCDYFPWFGQLWCQCYYGNITQIFSVDFG